MSLNFYNVILETADESLIEVWAVCWKSMVINKIQERPLIKGVNR
jgi:hypothetical protein